MSREVVGAHISSDGTVTQGNDNTASIETGPGHVAVTQSRQVVGSDETVIGAGLGGRPRRKNI